MYLEIPNALRRGQLVNQPPVPAFFQDEPAQGKKPRRVTYWLFFGFERPRGARRARRGHEGDWERVSIDLDADDDPSTLTTVLGRVPWDTVKRTAIDGHPVLYATQGTHALTLTRPATTKRSLAWKTWAPPGGIRDVTKETWYGFGGAWGHAGARGGRTGPLGPSAYARPL
jgi:hypothetical protein